MTEYQVTCINVSRIDPTPGGITHIGILFRKFTRREAVALIDDRKGSFYTFVSGKRADVITVHPWYGEPYLTTAPDNTTFNNLLSLPICG